MTKRQLLRVVEVARGQTLRGHENEIVLRLEEIYF